MMNVGHKSQQSGDTEGSYCCGKREDGAHLGIVITGMKERIDHLQQGAECEKFGDNCWFTVVE